MSTSSRQREGLKVGREEITREQADGKRAPYSKPELVDYGDISHLTAGNVGSQADMMVGMMDGMA